MMTVQERRRDSAHLHLLDLTSQTPRGVADTAQVLPHTEEPETGHWMYQAAGANSELTQRDWTARLHVSRIANQTLHPDKRTRPVQLWCILTL